MTCTFDPNDDYFYVKACVLQMKASHPNHSIALHHPIPQFPAFTPRPYPIASHLHYFLSRETASTKRIHISRGFISLAHCWEAVRVALPGHPVDIGSRYAYYKGVLMIHFVNDMVYRVCLVRLIM
jgi:hypothetical protein